MTSCSARKPVADNNSFEKYIVDIDTVQELALNEVATSNNYFNASADRHTEIIQRFWYFSENHNKAKPVFDKKTKTVQSSGDVYIYSLNWKGDKKNSNTYKVICKLKSGAVNSNADMNSKNLTRFLNEGTLEVSLLKE